MERIPKDLRNIINEYLSDYCEKCFKYKIILKDDICKECFKECEICSNCNTYYFKDLINDICDCGVYWR